MKNINILFISLILFSFVSPVSAHWWGSGSTHKFSTTPTRYGTISLNLTNADCTSNSTWVCGNGLFNYSFTDNYTVQTNLYVVDNNNASLPLYFKNVSGGVALIYTNLTSLNSTQIYVNATNRSFNNSAVCTDRVVFRFCNDFEGSSIAGNWTASAGTLTQTGNGYLRFVSATGNLEYARSSYSPDAAGSWSVLADIAAESTVDGYGFVGQTGTGSFGSLNSPQIGCCNIQGSGVMNLYNYNAAGTTTAFTTAASFWDRPTNVSVEVRKTTGTAQAYIYTQGGNFVERQTSTTNIPSSTNGLGLYEANSIPLILNWFAVSDYNTTDSGFGTFVSESYPYPVVPIIASNTTRYSNITVVTKTSDTPVKMINLTVSENYTGTMSVRIHHQSLAAAGVRSYIFINDTYHAIGCATTGADGDIWCNTTISIGLLETASEISIYAEPFQAGVHGFRVDSLIVAFDYDSSPLLTYPLNGTNIITTFPPISTELNVTWYNLLFESPSVNVQLASDVNFNILLVNATTANDYYLVSLQPGTYYWRAAYLDTITGQIGVFSDIESFTITASTGSLSAGANIQGVVYETINGVIYPIEGAIITVTNSSLYNSNETRTASNGYYLITGLSNFTTYSIDVSKTGYDTPARFYFTTNNTTITHNVELQRCTSSFNCYFDSQFVRFHVQNMFGKVYSGVVISAYLGTATTTTISGTTDSTGSVDFLLSKQNMYRITFVSASQGINVTWNLYPKEDYYTLIINGIDNFENCAAKNISISATDLNATHQRLNLNYSDPSGTTTRINFTVYYANNRTVYATQGNVTASTWNTYIDVPMGNATDGVEYIYGYNSSLDVCSEIGSYKAIIFPPLGGKLINIGLSDGWLQTISIILIVVIGAMFGARNVSNGAISVSLAGMFFTFVGWFKVANFNTWSTSGNAALSWSILISCLVISLILHMRKREVSNI